MSFTETNVCDKKEASETAHPASQNKTQNKTQNKNIEIQIPAKDFETLAITAAKQQISTEALISRAICATLQELTSKSE